MKELMDMSDKYIVNTYTRYPVVLVRGLGFKVWDTEDKEYIDFISGLGVNNVGHCHPKVVEAIKKQAETLIHVSNLYYIKSQAQLAKILVENSFADKCFFCNSGAEANEAAIKLARKSAKENFGSQKYEIITMKESFHGRTLATVTATAQEKFHKGFEPLLPGFKYVPYNDISSVEKSISKNTCAILVEPIQGEGGVNVPNDNYLKDLRKLCDDYNLLLIFDEVQTGMGRTGTLFAYEHSKIEPDIMTLAKSLGGGMAIGAMLAKEKVAQSFVPGSHASTFGGNPLASAAGVAAVTAIIEEGMLSKCQEAGRYFIKKLENLKGKYPFIKEVRGKGLMIGLELGFEGKEIVNTCLEKGFLINCTMGTVLRFLPPLIITEKEVDQLIATLDNIFKNL